MDGACEKGFGDWSAKIVPLGDMLRLGLKMGVQFFGQKKAGEKPGGSSPAKIRAAFALDYAVIRYLGSSWV